MSLTHLTRTLTPRATVPTAYLTHHHHNHSLPPPPSSTTTVTTAVSILTHHRSKSRWSTLRTTFPSGFSPPETSQILLQIRNNPHLALHFFNFTKKHHSLSTDLHTYATIIHILARARLKARAQAHMREAMRVLGVQSFDLFKVLVETYSSCGSAPFVFDLLLKSMLDGNHVGPCVDIVRLLRSRGVFLHVGTINSLIKADLKSKGCFFGFDLYKELFVCHNDDGGGDCGTKVLPNVHTFNELMHSFLRGGVVDMVEEVWIEMVKAKCSANCYSYSILMEAYCEGGEIEKARSVWEELRLKGLEPDVVAYNTLIGGYCRLGEVEKGEELYREMVMSGVEGTWDTYQCLVKGYCFVGDVDAAVLLFKDMRRKGFSPDSCTVESMVRVLYEKKPVSEALEFFRIATENADIVARETSYELLIKGLCEEGQMEEALKLQAQMVGKGFRPNADIYGAFIDGYIKQGQPDVAESLRKEISMILT